MSLSTLSLTGQDAAAAKPQSRRSVDRDLWAEGYHLEPFLAPHFLAVLKPGATRPYVINLEEMTCDCPATGMCCHLRQWETLLLAQVKDYARRRRNLAKFSGTWEEQQKRARLIRTLDGAEWSLWALWSKVTGGDFMLPDRFTFYVAPNAEMEPEEFAAEEEAKAA